MGEWERDEFDPSDGQDRYDPEEEWSRYDPEEFDRNFRYEYLEKEYREKRKRGDRRWMVVLLIALLLLAGLLLYPSLKKPAELASLNEIPGSEETYVCVTVPKISETGLNYAVEDRIKGQYYYALEDGVCYFFRLKGKGEGKASEVYENVRLTGTLYEQEDEFDQLVTAMSESLNCPEEAIREIAEPRMMRCTSVDML